jgi:uncharacterized protein
MGPPKQPSVIQREGGRLPSSNIFLSSASNQFGSMFFKAAKRGDNTFFKYAITLTGVIVGAIVGQIPLAVYASEEMRQQGRVAASSFDIYKLGLDENLLFALILLSFVGAFAGLYVGVRYFHFKQFRDIMTGRPRFDWRRAAFGFLFWFGISLLLEAISYALNPAVYEFTFQPNSFALLLLLALTLLPVQTTAEEALFRGYLMQGLGLATRLPWVALLLTSAAFGLLHFANLEVQAFGMGLMMTYYIGIGLLLGVVTLMDEGTELAVGIHAATNIYSATIVGYADASLQTPALFKVSVLDAPLMLAVTFLAGVLFLFIAARRFGWKDWGKLLRPIPREEDYDTTI